MPNIMEDSHGKKKVVVTYNSLFLNCDAIFIEYDDVIKCPFFVFLLSFKDNESLNTLFDLTEISSLNIDELYEWYINRKDQNILKCLPVRDGVIESYFQNNIDLFNQWCLEFLYNEINEFPEFVNMDTEMSFSNALDLLLKKTLVSKFYIYTPIESVNIKNDIMTRFGNKVKYVHGDLVSVLKENKITSNSTFVFSDITKVLAIKEAGILNQSSIVIADKYGYNYKDEKNVIIDIESLTKEALFKMDFFDNINIL